jgi:formylglycine-generating enzyme required for sulfatase activity
MAEESGRTLITPLIFNDEPVGRAEIAYFQFERYADTFARIIAARNTRTPLTIGVHGEWGSGKTTLMRRLQAKLDETKDWKTKPPSFVTVDERGPAFEATFRPCKTVWFNAWKYGREEALFVALIEEVLRQMRRDGAMQALYAELADPKQDKLKVSEAVISTLTRVFTAGQLNLDLTAFQTESRFRTNLAFLDEFQEVFDRLLRWYVARDRTAEGEFDDTKGVLVIFIDDLDRCLPEKTVQVLEAIKLMMGKRGTIFVLGASRRIVQAAVEAHYKLGKMESITPQDYLDKMIQLRFDLPPIRREDMGAFIGSLQEKGLEPTLLESLPIITEGVKTNPRRVKTFINHLDLQWGLLVNTGQAVEEERQQFYEWMVLSEVAPDFARRLREMGPQKRAEFIGEAGLFAGEPEQARLKLLEEWPQLREVAENERLLAVLQQGTFEFRPETLDKFIYLSAPPTVEAPPEEAPPEAEVVVPEMAEGREEAVVAEVERQGAEVAVPVFLKMVADETVPLRGRIAAAEALGRLGDPRLAEMVAIPAGEFTMGEGDGQHRVFVDAFKISKYPVTNMQYQTFVDATGHRAPGYWREGAYPPNKANHPVVNVSWHDAVAYCRWLSGATGKECRLPTEAEWEKTARGGIQIPNPQNPNELTDNPNPKRMYPWGDEFDHKRLNVKIGDQQIGDTSPVGVYPGGASPYGVMDMSGNVWEWCSSLYRDYPYDPDDGREDLEAEGPRVLRGGSWAHHGERGARCSYRNPVPPSLFSDYLGFRVLVSAALSPGSGLL